MVLLWTELRKLEKGLLDINSNQPYNEISDICEWPLPFAYCYFREDEHFRSSNAREEGRRLEQTYWLLAVDDEPDILRTNRKYLESRGYKVDTAICAMDGLELLRQRSYDCILLDVLLPDLNGFALCQAVRNITSAPILFLSCMDDEEDKIRGLMAGGDDYQTLQLKGTGCPGLRTGAAQCDAGIHYRPSSAKPDRRKPCNSAVPKGV